MDFQLLGHSKENKQEKKIVKDGAPEVARKANGGVADNAQWTAHFR